MSAAVQSLPFVDRRSRSGGTVDPRDYIQRAEKAAAIAEKHADAVDREARFPHEAFAAIRAQRLLGMLIPTDFAGDGARAGDVADVCAILGAGCASTGMIFAMHQANAACVIRHHRQNAWLQEFLADCARQQYLIAASTTEGNNGANVRSSAAAIKLDKARVRLERDASCVSYGAEADAILTTARRADAAAASDQVLVVFRRSDYTLEPTQSWDTFGMRGACSLGYRLRAEGQAEQVLPEPYERIHNQSMAPYAHLMWSSTWQGIAASAFRRARAFVRHAARASGGRLPPGAPHLTRARVALETLRSANQGGLATFERNASEPGGLTSMNAQLSLSFLKVQASELAVETVMESMRACGLSGYRNDSEFSLGRHLRDILSTPIMVHNDRILAASEAAVLTSEPPLWFAQL